MKAECRRLFELSDHSLSGLRPSDDDGSAAGGVADCIPSRNEQSSMLSRGRTCNQDEEPLIAPFTSSPSPCPSFNEFHRRLIFHSSRTSSFFLLLRGGEFLFDESIAKRFRVRLTRDILRHRVFAVQLWKRQREGRCGVCKRLSRRECHSRIFSSLIAYGAGQTMHDRRDSHAS